MRSTLLEFVDTALQLGFSVSDDGVVTPQQWLIGDLGPVKKTAEFFTNSIQEQLKAFETTDTLTATAIDQAVQGQKPSAPVNIDGQEIQIPPPGTNPEDVDKWWTGLTPEQRQQLIARHPPELGNSTVSRRVLGTRSTSR